MGIFGRYAKWIDSRPWHTIVAAVLHLSIAGTIIYVGAWACVEPFKPEGLRYTWSEWRELQKKRDAPLPPRTWRQEMRQGDIEAGIEMMLERCPWPIGGGIFWNRYGDIIEIVHPDITLYHAMLVKESGRIDRLLRMGYRRIEMRGAADRFVFE
jgi:hypothetical protein